MHTFNGKKTRIHFNSDMSGDCIVINTDTEQKVEIPCEDIISFVAEYVRSERIGKIEQMGTDEILGLK